MTQASAWCRIQLRNGLDFDLLVERLDYLHALGISHLYLSPIFKATSGSTHGYDCVDPNVIDPVLGGEAGFERLCLAVSKLEMGLVLDIVPNHLGVGPENPYWQAMLRDGPAVQATPAIFDVDWNSIAGGTPGKILIPVLGAPLDEVLGNGELRVEQGANKAHLTYYEHEFPLAKGSIDDSNEPTPLDTILARQHWELSWWRNGNRLLNWRRFFDITTLAGVRVEDPAVFDLMHEKVFELLERDVVKGLRVDHIDGLADPAQYLRWLDDAWRKRRADAPWILVEKILGPDETLPQDWQTAGTTGYETLNRLSQVFVHPDGVASLKAIWRSRGQNPDGLSAELARAKRDILTINLAAELNRLSLEICQCPSLDFTLDQVAEALVRMIIATHCYRSYGAAQPAAFDRALKDADWTDLPAALPRAIALAMPSASLLRRRYEQLSAPAMAKSLEDTTFYRWYPVLALNEVGGEPDHIALPDALHAAFADPTRTRARALISTATHDTKHGEDARVRLLMLTHPGIGWPEQLLVWEKMSDPLRAETQLTEKERLFILQNIYSIWPTSFSESTNFHPILDRLNTYFTKAFREAKEKTNWLSPDEGYENRVHDFVSRLLGLDAFRSSLSEFVSTTQAHTRRLMLAMTALKYTLPGVPDLYHGSELSDFSLVDPDNRRPVDIDDLRRWLMSTAEENAQALADNAELEPNAKQRLIQRLLKLRQLKPGLFADGPYRPLNLTDINGPLFAFERLDGPNHIIVVVNRWPADADSETLERSLLPICAHMTGRSWHEWVTNESCETIDALSARQRLAHWAASVYVRNNGG
ncbi:MAG: malto-oligosyltrehalose synthase [Burkholderiaceae bacterium]